LPPNVTFVPGSIAITAGPNAGTKTDSGLDDQAEYDPGNHTLTVRLGSGADATQGGALAVGESTTIVFRVTIDASAAGTVENQATITAAGEQGSPSEATVTDGNGPAPGSPPTILVVEECASDADCSAPKPHCHTVPYPNVCVECLEDIHCAPLEPICELSSHTCVCQVAGPETCGNALDEDCDGALDNGCGGAGGGGAGGSAGGAGAEGGAASGTGGKPPVAAGSSAVGSGGASSDDGDLAGDSGSLRGGGCGCVVPRNGGPRAPHLLMTGLAGLLAMVRRHLRARGGRVGSSTGSDADRG
jgi:hypothetical protein